MSDQRGGSILIACILASSLVGMDSLMTVVALPAIAEDFGVGLAAQQWIIAVFLLALGSLLLVGGALGDVYGQWTTFGVGVAGFGTAAVVCAIAPATPILLLGRLCQGIAAALLVPSVLALLTTTFSGAARSKAIARWSAWSGLSVIAGPAVGGLLISAFSWRAVYWVHLPLTVVVIALLVRTRRQRSAETASGRVDLVGALLAVPSVGAPVFYLIQAPTHGWGDVRGLGALLVGLVSLGSLLLWERRVPNPLLPLDLFRIRTFTVLNLVTFVLYGALISAGTYTVMFLQGTLGRQPALAGVVGAVPIMVLFALSARFGALADRYGMRPFIGGGAIVAGAGIALLLRVDGESDLLTVVMPSVLVHGLGLAMLVAPLTSGVMSAVPPERAGAASGVNNAVARIGSMVAIAGIGVLISLQFSASIDRESETREVGPQLQRVLDDGAENPLDSGGGTVVEPLLSAASVDAFRVGMGVSGALAIVAGVLAFAGLREREAATYDAADTIGCPITGARTHPDAPPIGSRAAQRCDDSADI